MRIPISFIAGFILLFLSACNSPRTCSFDSRNQMFDVYWSYKGGTIKFSVYNMTTEDVLLALPLKNHEAYTLDYQIYHGGSENAFMTYQGGYAAPHFEILSGGFVNKKGTLSHTGGSDYSMEVPILAEKFDQIFTVNLSISAIPFSQLSQIKDSSSFMRAFHQNIQTYIVNFREIGHREKRGKMELSEPSTGGHTPVNLRKAQEANE